MDENSPLELRVVVVSPSDVPEERVKVQVLVDRFDKLMRLTQHVQVNVWRWEADSHLDFHPEGPQGVIDSDMNIEQADIVIGIFWARFGTPTYTESSGTEHELNKALAAKLASKSNLPEIQLFFKTSTLPSSVDIDQLKRLRDFKANALRKANCAEYLNITDFEMKVEKQLLSFLQRRLPRLPIIVPSQPERLVSPKNTYEKHPPLQMEPIETEVFQDFQIDRRRLENPNPVEYLWVDVCSPGKNSIFAEIGAENDTPHLMVKFKNSPQSWPGNIAIRPRGGRAVSALGKRSLTFEARKHGPNGLDSDPSTEVCFGVRIVNGWCQHWAYGGERRYLQMPISSKWEVFELPLQSTLWWHFPSELFRHEAPSHRDFSSLTLLVLEFGSSDIDRPGAGEGVVLIRDVRLKA